VRKVVFILDPALWPAVVLIGVTLLIRNVQKWLIPRV